MKSFDTLRFEFGADAAAGHMGDLVRLAAMDLDVEGADRLLQEEVLNEIWPATWVDLELAAIGLDEVGHACVEQVRVEARLVEIDVVFREEPPYRQPQQLLVNALHQLARELGGADPRLLAQRRWAQQQARALAEVDDASPEALLTELERAERQLSPLNKVFLRDFRLRVRTRDTTDGQRARAAEVLSRLSGA